MAQSLTQTMPACSRAATRWARARSRAHRPEASPYGVLLASATASSSVSNGCTVSTGPKTSSCTVRESLPRSAMTVGR